MHKASWIGVSLMLALGWSCGGDGPATSNQASTAGQPSAPSSAADGGSAGRATADRTGGTRAAATGGMTSTTPPPNRNTGASGTVATSGGAGGGTAVTAAAGAGAAGTSTSTAGATAGAAGDATTSGGAGATAPSGGAFPPADTVDITVGPGPFTPMHIEDTGPNGNSWIFFPTELGKDGLKHPIFQWGPGAGTGPMEYTDHLNHLASHGFVIICQPSTMSGQEALDWILEQNDDSGSMFHQKLDPMKVGRGGHSMGSFQTFSESADPRLTLYVLVCGGGGGEGAAQIHAPTLILGGDSDFATSGYNGDFDRITTPVAFLIKSGTDHIACARNNLNPWTAFMRWHWYGEEAKYKPDFLDTGTYCKDPWTCMTKGL
ncbi:MAG TPA: hypothetical protein VEX18_18885 [Polyangiaceae bacterium]|nr:hypothetical protein [Polyangiaceae bacterium]